MSDFVNPFRYQLECTLSSATIYVGGDRCTPANVRHLASLARDLPAGIRTLRADVHAATSVNLDALTELRQVLGEWRAVRSGAVRLLTRSERPVALRYAAEVTRARPRLSLYGAGRPAAQAAL